MKAVKRFAILLGVTVVVLASILGCMLFLSRSGESKARDVCSSVDIGKPFEGKELKGKKPFQRKKGDDHFYSYLFLMNFDTAAECKVFVDEQNVVTQVEVDVH